MKNKPQSYGVRPCLWGEWLWVSLSRTATSGVTDEPLGVIQPYHERGLCLVDFIASPTFVGSKSIVQKKIRTQGELFIGGLQ